MTYRDYGGDIAELAALAWGAPNDKLSRDDKLRFGSKGSKSLDLREGIWFDHEARMGGGFVKLFELAHGRKPLPSEYRRGGAQASAERPSDAERIDFAHRIWLECEEAAGGIAEDYLRGRGINIIGDDIRFHPDLYHGPSETRWPALVAAVRNEKREFVGVHRIWVRRRTCGKAPVEPNKMSLGPVRGGSVRLAEAGSILLLGEGIETVLSAMQATRHPGWAALGVRNMSHIELPDCVRELILLGDGDPTAEAEAVRTAYRWTRAGIKVRIAPCPQGRDFNDLLLEGV
jgi:hypothetical protein